MTTERQQAAERAYQQAEDDAMDRLEPHLIMAELLRRHPETSPEPAHCSECFEGCAKCNWGKAAK